MLWTTSFQIETPSSRIEWENAEEHIFWPFPLTIMPECWQLCQATELELPHPERKIFYLT